MLAALVCLALLRPAWTASADQASPGDASKREAQRLATKAIECLNRGEDATDETAKERAYREGLGYAERAVALDEGNADAHFAIFGNQGRLLLLEGVAPNPISLLQVNRDLERALEIDPNHTDALAAKGGLYRQLPWMLGGSLSLAETCLTKAIELDPEAVSARIELAATYRDMGHPERGVPLLQTAAAIAERQGKRRQLGQAKNLMDEIGAPASAASADAK